jgi:hypothetical protein
VEQDGRLGAGLRGVFISTPGLSQCSQRYPSMSDFMALDLQGPGLVGPVQRLWGYGPLAGKLGSGSLLEAISDTDGLSIGFICY